MEANQLDNVFIDFNSLSKNGLKISIISNIKNKRFEVNNIKKGDGMFFLLVA